MSAFAPRPILFVASEHDDIFPPFQYADVISGFESIELISHQDADHSFSACRSWLVLTVTEWLRAKLGS